MLKIMWTGIIRQLRLLAVLATVTVLGGTAWSYLTNAGYDTTDPAVAMSGPGGDRAGDRVSGDATYAWGDEMLADIHEHVINGLPIRIANACGLGASSCFKCHNGKRAAAPAMDAVKNPWHDQHQRVNGSCVGCHQGNPRLMKQDIAHSGMVANPISKPETSCFVCHEGGDAQGKLNTYQKLLSNTTGE